MNHTTRSMHMPTLATSMAALLLALGASADVQSAKPKPGKGAISLTMAERCQMMMSQEEKLVLEMKSQDSVMTLRVAAMNAAPDNRKLELIAGIVTTVVDQRSSRDAQRGKLNEDMVMHAMQHTQMGADSLLQCPMKLSEMKGVDAAPTMHHSDLKTSK